MPMVFGDTYPLEQVARAAAVLEAAGAFDPAPTEMPCPSLDWVTFYISYTRGAAGGDMQFRVELSPYSADRAGVEDWFRASLYAGGPVGSGADSLSNLQRNAIEYGSGGAGIENVIYGPIAILKTAERARISCAESGAVGTPGTAHIVALFGFREATD